MNFYKKKLIYDLSIFMIFITFLMTLLTPSVSLSLPGTDVEVWIGSCGGCGGGVGRDPHTGALPPYPG